MCLQHVKQNKKDFTMEYFEGASRLIAADKVVQGEVESVSASRSVTLPHAVSLCFTLFRRGCNDIFGIVSCG